MESLLRHLLQPHEKETISEYCDFITKELKEKIDTKWVSIFLSSQNNSIENIFGTFPGNSVDIIGDFISKNKNKVPTFFSSQIIKSINKESNTLVAQGVIIPIIHQKSSLGSFVFFSEKKIHISKSNEKQLNNIISVSALIIKNIQLNEALVKALNKKELFISAAAHELRTPLSVISSYNQLVKNKLKNGNLVKTNWLSTISRNVKKLELLISDLFIISQINNNLFHYSFKKTDLVKLLANLIKDLDIVYSHKLILKCKEESVFVSGDSIKLALVFSNIINNGIKHSPKASAIILEIKVKNSKAIILVKDSGSGIKKEDVKKVFNKNFRGSDKNNNGLGLGLYLCKKIINGHSGAIKINSKINRGTTVSVSIPLFS